jgi:hypothetical protein
LNILGYTFKQNRQDIYYDGHERPDVIKYRKKFLEEIFSYEKYMTTFDDETLEPIPPILGPDEKKIILVTHDECIFYSYDGKRGVWVRNGELPLKKKGNGRCIMVSEFLTEIGGRLCLSQDQIVDNPDVPDEARTILKPGKNHEGYWKSDDLIDQEPFQYLKLSFLIALLYLHLIIPLITLSIKKMHLLLIG